MLVSRYQKLDFCFFTLLKIDIFDFFYCTKKCITKRLSVFLILFESQKYLIIT